MPDQAQLLPGTLDLLILRAVSLGPLHGYNGDHHSLLAFEIRAPLHSVWPGPVARFQGVIGLRE
jgi:hypothetical protein